MKIKEALFIATQRLKKEKIFSARLDSEVLLMHILQCNKTNLYVNYERELTNQQEKEYEAFLQQREQKIPIAYLTGHKEFMGLDFFVDRRVLIPRPETEILVEAVLKECLKYKEPVKILDLGTGSGAIALSLAYYYPQSQVYALDCSTEALEVTEKNSLQLGLAGRVHLLQGDLWDGVEEKDFSLIVSNPPYIAQKEMPELAKDVVDYEPHLALTDGNDGLTFYRRISDQVKDYLLPGGILALEVGRGQAGKVAALLMEQDIFAKKKILSDYAGIDRIILAWRKE